MRSPAVAGIAAARAVDDARLSVDAPGADGPKPGRVETGAGFVGETKADERTPG
jgi:hypothetical protein